MAVVEGFVMYMYAPSMWVPLMYVVRRPPYPPNDGDEPTDIKVRLQEVSTQLAVVSRCRDSRGKTDTVSMQ